MVGVQVDSSKGKKADLKGSHHGATSHPAEIATRARLVLTVLLCHGVEFLAILQLFYRLQCFALLLAQNVTHLESGEGKILPSVSSTP